ncbi:flagellar biosynthesis protein FlhA [Seleniivibrio sp.]|uniref:flagellar biosynthesis protein FlhA n=1 Tax=Seleniivibrio sp. TaxID=2898801 RepID=UPI0025E69F37|nr:flagellar biosynthesis protein FlhA [Seleniivibrio sp.]MCD8553920.1 flagellar biosynthesis protein FlhA [Seleniivibrio sp.]
MADAKEYLNILKQKEISFSVFFMAIIAVMVLPVPAILLDLLLTTSVALSIIILMVAIHSDQPLKFSTFPTVLLIVTLFRLSLNVATTRTILLHGYEGEDAAGEVIRAFGQFVVGGNYAVGIIVFLILIIINFMVITKGSTRIAEVAARFTLDAMPGKQMSIDADLNAGMISEDEARQKRIDIQREADYFGSMDGASKFVRGDAVAGLIITVINILGGLVIGVVQGGMEVIQAAERYTILTIGDGLVSQIPSLIISTAAGLIVSRAGSGGDLSNQLFSQLFNSTKVLGITGGILLFFAIIPGMPKLSFILLGSLFIYLAWLSKNAGKEKEQEKEKAAATEKEKAPVPEEDEVKSLLEMDIMELEIGFALIPLVDASQGGTLLNRIKAIRRQLALEMGFIVPPVRIRDNLQLDANGYAVMLKGVRINTGSIFPDKFLIMNPEGSVADFDGIPTKEPAYGLEAKWVDEAVKDMAEIEGCTIVDPSTVIATHLTEIIKSNAHELLGRQETQELLDKLKERYPKLVDDVIPAILDLGTVNRVLQALLKERVSIRNLQTILEILATYGMQNKHPDFLTERVRAVLKRQITESLLAADGKLYVFTLPSKVEQFVATNIQKGDDGQEIVIDPSVAQKILSAIIQKSDQCIAKSLPPVLIVSPPIRLPMRRFVEKFVHNINIMSHNEISDSVRIESLGMLEINI